MSTVDKKRRKTANNKKRLKKPIKKLDMFILKD